MVLPVAIHLNHPTFPAAVAFRDSKAAKSDVSAYPFSVCKYPQLAA